MIIIRSECTACGAVAWDKAEPTADGNVLAHVDHEDGCPFFDALCQDDEQTLAWLAANGDPMVQTINPERGAA